MRIAVLGAGIIGVTTAHALARAGADVVLIERRDGPALETSFANGGQISPSHSDPWAAPGVLGLLARSIARPDAPIRVRPSLDADVLHWARLFLANCSAERAVENSERMLRVARYGRDRLRALHNEAAIAFDHSEAGLLHVFRSPAAFETAKAKAARISALGCPRTVVDAETCFDLEPALAGADVIGGMVSPDDASGDAHAFAVGLLETVRALGANIRFGSAVHEVVVRGGRVTGVTTESGVIDADAVVVCLGWSAPRVLNPLGLRVPVLPAKGYSVTVPVGVDHTAPRMAVIDDERKLVASRLGNRLRVAGLAEIGRVDGRLDAARADVVLRGARALFAEGGDWSRAEPWAGLRPQTPDSVPILGPTPVGGLFLNVGHGTLGWTMSCGAGQVVADAVLGRVPEIVLSGLTLERFGI